MSQSDFLSVIMAVVFGASAGGFESAYAATHEKTTPSIKQRAEQYIDDSEITLNVKTRLLEDKKTRHLAISVKTTHGDVLLTGTVETFAQIKYVRQQVAKLPGVRTVKAQLTVKSKQRGSKGQHQTLSEYSTDAVITARIKAKLLAEKRLSARDITVKTIQGVVTLTGALDEQQQVEIAEKIARSVNEVKQVNNQLRIKG